MRTFVILLTLGVVCMAQYRPSYFPRPGGFSTSLSTNSEGAPVNLGDRNSAFHPEAPGSENYLVDTDQDKRFQNWPREKLPFWYINQQHIRQQQAQQVPCNGPDCQPQQLTADRGSFAGPVGSDAPRPSFSGSAAPRPSFAGSSSH